MFFFTVCGHVTSVTVGAQGFLTRRKPGVGLRPSSVFVLLNPAFKGSILCRRKEVLGYGAVVIAPSKNPTFTYSCAMVPPWCITVLCRTQRKDPF